MKNISNLDLEEKIVKLGYLLTQVRNTDKKYIKYSSLPKNEIGGEIRKLTKEIKSKLFDSNDEIKLSKKDIQQSIEKLNEIFLDIDRRNNISNVGFESAFDNKMIHEKLEKSDNYILNAIVNHALYNYDYNNGKTNKKSSKISVEDVIGEIAIIIYKDNNNKYYKKTERNLELKF